MLTAQEAQKEHLTKPGREQELPQGPNIWAEICNVRWLSQEKVEKEKDKE